MKKIVVGAGFSGLTLAWYLAKQGVQVEIYEESSKAGGLIQTEKGLSLRETAANALVASDDVIELFELLKIPWTKTKKEAKKRYIFRQGLRTWPLSIKETLDFIFRIFKNFVLSNARMPLENESIADWSDRVLNCSAKKYLVEPALQGIYAGDIEKLQAEILLKVFLNPKKKSKFRGSVAPLEGMQALIQALKADLQKMGVSIQYGKKVENLTEEMILAVPAHRAAEILSQSYPEVSQALNKIEMLNVASVHLDFKSTQSQIKGFGVLFPRDQGFQSLGVLSNTFIFPERGPAYSETWILGGAHFSEVRSLSDAQLISVILQDRERLFSKKSLAPDQTSVVNWSKAFPHYDENLSQFLKIFEKYPKLYLTGNYLGVLGLTKILSRNKKLAEEIARAG